jgi:CRISPR-associated protein Cas1
MANTGTEGAPLVPARMVNEFAYCPRLFYLEWVDGEFDDNHFTVEGQVVHRRVDEGEPVRALGAVDAATAGAEAGAAGPVPWQVRSIEVSSQTLGVSGKIDLVEGEGEGDGGEVMPVDRKRGKAPDVAEGAWEPERVQLCLYGLMLREAGYPCHRGELYFVGSRKRVEIAFDEALIARTLELTQAARRAAAGPAAPAPLVGSPKCDGCSLAGLCMPDELNVLRGATTEAPRPMAPARDDAQPVYVVEAGARVGISADCLEVRSRERVKLLDAALVDVSQVVLVGNAQISSQAVRALSAQGIPVAWLSSGGWLNGILDGAGRGQVALRQAQYAAAASAERALGLARAFVSTKILNCRTFLRRNTGSASGPGTGDGGGGGDGGAQGSGGAGAGAMRELAKEAERALEAPSMEVLLGIEGNAARVYFSRFGALLRGEAGMTTFDFNGRNRRPPKDAVNALLSFAYTMLSKDLVAAARIVGFDPWLGFMHQPRHGRFGLALDLMEEFRPLLADSVVVNAINTGAVVEADFLRRGIGVTLNTEGRRKFLRAWERRLAEKIIHPTFGYRVSYRRVLEMQCRLLARHLLGELEAYPGFRTR